MSIDNIATNYHGGYYSSSQAQMAYLNYDINTTVGSLSTEYFDISNNNIPKPTWSNKITVYKSSSLLFTNITIDLNLSVANITNENEYQQILVIANETPHINLIILSGNKTTTIKPGSA